MASPTWWTWVCVGSRSWWWTGKPGMLQSMGSQRVGHDWATELNCSQWWKQKTMTYLWKIIMTEDIFPKQPQYYFWSQMFFQNLLHPLHHLLHQQVESVFSPFEFAVSLWLLNSYRTEAMWFLSAHHKRQCTSLLAFGVLSCFVRSLMTL